MPINQIALITYKVPSNVSDQIKVIVDDIIKKWFYIYKLWETKRKVTLYELERNKAWSMTIKEMESIRVSVRVAK